MKFKQFLLEGEEMLGQIEAILDTMSPEEIDDFGAYLVDMFLDDLPEDEYNSIFTKDDVMEMVTALGMDFYDEILDELSVVDDSEDDEMDDEEDDEMDESYEASAKEIFKDLFNGAIGKSTDVDNYLDLVLNKHGLKSTDKSKVIKLLRKMGYKGDLITEAVARSLKSRNYNRKKRKYMAVSKAELRRTKAKRRIEARKNIAKRKRYYRANKVKLAAYQKSRRAAINKGKHNAKIRRPA